jgi:hypothetical protein
MLQLLLHPFDAVYHETFLLNQPVAAVAAYVANVKEAHVAAVASSAAAAATLVAAAAETSVAAASTYCSFCCC